MARMEHRDIKGRRIWRWDGLNTEAPADLTEGSTALGFKDFQVQAFGVFDGASVEVHGTLIDDAEPCSCSGPDGGVISLRAAGFRRVAEAPRALGPVIVGGAAATDLTVIIMGTEI